MLKGQREQEILNILKERGSFVDVNSLCKKLFASQSSIRRDLKIMEDKGLIRRSYGGAELASTYSTIMNFNERFHQNAWSKTVMARKALSLIKDNSVIFLDQSSSALFLAKELPNKSSLTVITNNVEILRLLLDTSITVISSGGHMFQNNRNCLLGKDAEHIFSNTFADFAFFSCKALSCDGIITDCSREEVALRATMLNNAVKKVFLCDQTKFNSRSTFIQCSLDNVDYLITDAEKSPFSKNFPALTVI